MKEALLKKRYGIPAALLIALLLSGTALAWYSFNTINSETTVQEPLSTTETKEFSANMYPGEESTWTFKIENTAYMTYDIKADLTYDAPSGVTITSFTVGLVDETDDLKDDGSAEFSISPKGTLFCSMTISAEKDAAPGNVLVSLAISRGTSTALE